MSLKPRKPLPKPQQKSVKVDISKADNVVCEECGNYLFIMSYVIKKVSAIMSPTGQDVIAPVQVYSCGNCGVVPKLFTEGTGLELGDE